MNILIGNNSSGKTLFLRKKYEENFGDVSTNLEGVINLGERKISQDKLDYMSDIIDAQDMICYGQTAKVKFVDGIAASEEFNKIIFILSIDASVLVLDEPTGLVSYNEACMLHDILAKMDVWYKEVWISSHDSGVELYPNARFFTVGSGLVLSEVSKKDAWKVIEL